MRVGGEVTLHWTSPKQTTDKLSTKGAIAAEICRQLVSDASQVQRSSCTPVARLPVTPGESDAMDTLPGVLAGGPPQLLAYSVQLMNSAGKTAGPSAAVYAAAGAAPASVASFAGEPTSAGVELHWQRQAGAGAVELDRTLLDPAPETAATRKSGLPGEQKQPVEIKLRAGDPVSADMGGMVDRTVEVGHTYRYSAQRVLSVVIGGQTLELRSAPSKALTFAVKDEFPPAVPEGLVAVPSFVEQKAAIDLSWEPVIGQDLKPKVAGYKVYRRDGADGAWKLLGQVTAAAYRDATVAAGQMYTYRVTAVSSAGNESAPGSEATERGPQGQP